MARRMWGKLAVLQAVALSVTACGVSGVEGDPWNDPLAGEWVGCLNEGAGDYGRRMYFYADSFSSTTSTYSTNDRTCGGTETSVATEIWRFALGEQVTAQVGSAGTAVTARQINLQNSFETLFTIVYVDEQSTPRLLYFGELALDPLQDGSAPEKRPEVLSVATTLAGQ